MVFIRLSNFNEYLKCPSINLQNYPNYPSLRMDGKAESEKKQICQWVNLARRKIHNVLFLILFMYDIILFMYSSWYTVSHLQAILFSYFVVVCFVFYLFFVLFFCVCLPVLFLLPGGCAVSFSLAAWLLLSGGATPVRFSLVEVFPFPSILARWMNCPLLNDFGRLVCGALYFNIASCFCIGLL